MRTMNPYMFVIESEPASDNRYFGKIGWARFHIWVISSSEDAAIIRAFGYIQRQHWTPIKIEHAFEIDPEHLPDLHEDEAALYAKARVYGIAADIIAVPLEDGNPDDPAMLLPPY